MPDDYPKATPSDPVGDDEDTSTPLDYEPARATPEGFPVVEKESLSKSEASADEKAEVMKTPEVLSQEVGPTSDTQGNKKLPAQDTLEDELSSHVVDQTTDQRQMRRLDSSHPLTQYADVEEEEFIEEVEGRHHAAKPTK